MMIENYLNDETHSKFLEPYYQASTLRKDGTADYFLIFTKEWKEKNLPPDGTSAGFDYELLDSETNVVYKTSIYCAYEKYVYSVFDDGYEEINGDFYTLMPYFYREHHCPCHRHGDAIREGLNENWEDFECAGNRFKIIAIRPKGSDIILYSETHALEKLEAKLK